MALSLILTLKLTLKLTLIVTLFSCFMLFRALSHDLQTSLKLTVSCFYSRIQMPSYITATVLRFCYWYDWYRKFHRHCNLMVISVSLCGDCKTAFTFRNTRASLLVIWQARETSTAGVRTCHQKCSKYCNDGGEVPAIARYLRYFVCSLSLAERRIALQCWAIYHFVCISSVTLSVSLYCECIVTKRLNLRKFEVISLNPESSNWGEIVPFELAALSRKVGNWALTDLSSVSNPVMS